jgi:hypothetical protein
MRAADGGKQQRIRLRRDNAVKAGINGHGRDESSDYGHCNRMTLRSATGTAQRAVPTMERRVAPFASAGRNARNKLLVRTAQRTVPTRGQGRDAPPALEKPLEILPAAVRGLNFARS